MPTGPDYASILERLLPILTQACDRAGRRGAPVLASLTVKLDAGASAPEVWPAEYFVMEQPERDFSLTGLGQSAWMQAAGATRFVSARDQLASLLAESVIEQTAMLSLTQPVCFGGFAFDNANGHAASEWASFPEAQVVVPRLLFAQQGDSRSLTLNALVAPDSDVESIAALLMNDARHAFGVTPAAGAGPASCLIPDGEAERERWRQGVRSLTDLIGAGEAEKVVLARRVAVEAEAPIDVASVLARLRERYRNCTVFAVRNGGAVFLGATPEMLVHLDGGVVRADCLAGSAARGADAAQDATLGEALLSDDKERREHAMVVRGLEESLRDLCSEVVAPAAPELRRMANVQHLYTPLTATTETGAHVLDLVERLHPTAATGGLPKGRALCLIRERERFSRGWYAGPIGWMDANGSGEFAVALRSALVDDQSAYLYAGCGIVRGSDPEREYAESGLKLGAMLWALNGKS
jgi:isochorismate synthase